MQLLAMVVVAMSVLGFCHAQELSASSSWFDDIASASLDLGIESSGGRMCDGRLGDCYDDDESMMDSDVHGRLLRRVRYYISYGALAANRVPCPPRSGRSYYTNNCYRARGPVHPYRRGCSAITRCRRYTS